MTIEDSCWHKAATEEGKVLCVLSETAAQAQLDDAVIIVTHTYAVD
ncbi:hypothetical protein [Paraburkholderia terrae]